jgi:hypothetical protein
MAFSSGKYYNEVRQGNVFIGSTAAAGTAFPISTGTAVTFGLWNTSSNKNAVLMQLRVGFTSGTIALGEIGLANQYCGFALATAAPLSAFTDGTPKNAMLGAGNSSSMRFTPSGATLTAGGTACWWSGASIESATVGLGIQRADFDLDGSIIVPPGQLVFLCGSVAQTALFTASLMWAEVPAN